MILVDFKKKDAHFWIALAYGLTYLMQGFLGVIDDYLVPLGLSWRTYGIWPLSALQDMPWTLIIMVSGLLLFLDAFRVYKERWQRFSVWLFMMVMLWGVTCLVGYTTVVLVPHPIGFLFTNVVATATYSLLFLKGPPLIGTKDVLIEKGPNVPNVTRLT